MSTPKDNTPLQIVILGGTGDLANRKLIPALFHLFLKGRLPKQFSIIGFARSIQSDKEYRVFVRESIKTHDPDEHKTAKIRSFCSHVQYVSGLFDSDAAYRDLLTALEAFDREKGVCTSKLYYLAAPPQFYSTIFSMLHKHQLHRACEKTNGFARVLVEKPFGYDFQSAQKLDRKLGSLFDESQIYRIDHYLAKEAVQNILSFRFANTLLHGIWNREHIDHVDITMYETVDVDDRGAFYDKIGALRDVGQNHLLQLYALIAMREPRFFEAEFIRKERLAALRKLRQYRGDTLHKHFHRAQYSGYKKTEGVQKNSDTETFFELRLFSNDRRWKRVPFYLSAGKALNEARVEVTIYLKDVASGLFETATTCNTMGNTITLTIQPDQAMRVTLNAKLPGLGYQLEPRTLTFDCPLGENEVKNSYEKVLLDCIRGDQTLFTTTKEVFATWKFIGSVRRNIDIVELQTYRRGSKGPKDRLEHITEE